MEIKLYQKVRYNHIQVRYTLLTSRIGIDQVTRKTSFDDR
jgi:hypothetical protein